MSPLDAALTFDRVTPVRLSRIFFGKGSANCDSLNWPTLILIFVFVHL